MSKKPNTTPPNTTKEPAEAGSKQLSFYIKQDLLVRLSRYQYEKFPGQLNVRTQIINDAIEAKLDMEGF